MSKSRIAITLASLVFLLPSSSSAHEIKAGAAREQYDFDSYTATLTLEIQP